MLIKDVKVNISASRKHKVMTGNFGLSESESDRLKKYIENDGKIIPMPEGKKKTLLELRGREKLTDKQEKTLADLEDLENNPKINSLTDLQREDMQKLISKRDNPDIGTGGRTLIRELITEAMYELPKDVSSKYLAHGNFHEDFCIRKLGELLGLPLVKNTKREYYEEYLMSGECDILLDNAIIDIKNPYDPFTFTRNMNDDVDDEYWWQLQDYMFLYDKPTSYLVYCLNENLYMDDP